MLGPAHVVAAVATLLVLGLSACAAEQVEVQRPVRGPATASGPADQATRTTPPPPARTDSIKTTSKAAPKAIAPTAAPAPEPTMARATMARATMARATMRIPAIGLRDVAVVPYRGSPDDGPGTRIQDGGVAASPFGARAGVGPGQVGNYIVTAHRTSAGAPFADLPALDRGEHALIAAGGKVFDYRIVETRSTSFRSQRSLARQAAAVPGHPGRRATRPMITLSTCATPEDHARGNYWADEFGNPEHRIDKIGVLVDVHRK